MLNPYGMILAKSKHINDLDIVTNLSRSLKMDGIRIKEDFMSGSLSALCTLNCSIQSNSWIVMRNIGKVSVRPFGKRISIS